MDEQIGATTDRGYAYTCALCDAIESFAAGEEARSGNAFMYRGAHLRFAVERSLYIALVNSSRLQQYFRLFHVGGLPATMIVGSDVERAILAYLLPDVDEARIQIRSPFGSICRRGMTIPLAALKRLIDVPFRMSGPRYRSMSGAIAVCVVHEKFVRYLEPVMALVRQPYAYLIAPRESFRSFLVKNRIPFVCRESGNVSGGVSAALAAFPQLTALYDSLYATIERMRPGGMIVAEGNAPFDEVVNQVAQRLSVPIVCLQQGWSPIVHNGFRHMSFTKMLIWGDGFGDILKPHNPLQRFVATGNHAVVGSRRKDAASAIGFFFQAPCALITQRSWDAFFDFMVWAAHTFSDMPILVREHPNYPLSPACKTAIADCANVRLMPPDTTSLSEALLATKVAVSIYSTTVLEGIAAGIVPLVFNMTSLPSFFPDLAGAGIEARTTDEARSALTRLVRDEAYYISFAEGMDRFRARYFTALGSIAAERTADELIRTMRFERGAA